MTTYIGNVKFSVQLYKKEANRVVQNFNTCYTNGKVLDGFIAENYVTPEQQETLLDKLAAQVTANIDEYLENSLVGAKDDLKVEADKYQKVITDSEKAMIDFVNSSKNDISKAATETKEEIIKEIASDENVEQINKNATNIDSLKEEKADTMDYKDNVLRLLSGETELSRVIIRGGSGSGVDAREIELRKSATAIQWRYTGDETWNDLVALAEITGAQGEQGIQGEKGEAGAQGEQGPAGEPGKDGRGITSVTIKADGHLQIDYSDGTEVDVGKVTGNDGLDGTSGVPVRIEKTSSDATAELDPNKLYIFPEMSSLTYTLATPSDTSIANEYHFVFRSGATSTELVHPSGVSVPDGFTVDKNKVYEISILEGCLAYQSWAVS